ncbi:hypothetical protein GAR06_03437 [Micromonospora saelicesensis]|uniref:hypothetical protein n=1 Tax=Micromonospora saelicesensis TaxID=285676 RepID=UPI000DC53042|nr:hypothetical protein [Micromonospora saelicesensis]RAO45246.1 hypothetical protein GAR06_03437 [Micromonospora saelicesensis]RAO50856.1 hypothetical protein PSN01_04420 [Micromonospora saelicesensis]
MTSGDVPEVPRARLDPLRRAGDGGQGIVYFTDRVKINVTWDAAYKEYLPTTSFDPYALRRMVAFVPTLDGGSGRWLCENTSWPAALVVDGGQVSGFLMRRIPDRFRMPWGENGADVPAALQYLLNPQTYLNRKGVRLNEGIRLRLLEAIADVMARLHSLGIVVGDLSPNNLLVDIGDPGCFFIDCDAMRLQGQDVLEQVETPEWGVQGRGREPIATVASDSYKFGLLAIRLFAQDQMGQDASVLAGVSSDLGVLARRSVDGNSTSRPSMGDWLGALRTAQSRRASWQAPAARRVTPSSQGSGRATVPPQRTPTTAYASTAPPMSTRHGPPPAQQPRPQPQPVAPQPASAARPPQGAEKHPVLYAMIGWAVILLVLACIVGLFTSVVNLF